MGGPNGDSTGDGAGHGPHGSASRGQGTNAGDAHRPRPTGTASRPTTSAEATVATVEWPPVERLAERGGGWDDVPVGHETGVPSTDARSAGWGSAPPRRGSAAASDTPPARSAVASSTTTFEHDPDSDVDPETDTALTDSPMSYGELLRHEFGAELIEERVGE